MQARSIALIVATMVTSSACSSGASKPPEPSGGGGGEWAPSPNPPRVDPPAEPGILAVGPAGLTVAVGQVGQLSADVFRDGVGSTAGAVTWTSSEPNIATVNAAGAVTGLASGECVVTARDGAGRVGAALVSIAATAPEGPAAVQFEVPAVRLEKAGSATVTFTVTDAAGDPVATPENFALVADPSGIVSVSPSGEILALAAGVASVRGSIGEAAPLAGELTVVVTAPAQTTESCPDPILYGVAGCSIVVGPEIFTKPGLAAAGPIQVLVWRSARIPICVTQLLEAHLDATVENPDEVHLQIAGVVEIDGSGLLRSVAPGATGIRAFKEGVFCDEWSIHVGADLAGSWGVACPDDYTGQAEVASWPGIVYPHTRAMAGSTGVRFMTYADSASCIVNDPQQFSCSAEGKVLVRGLSAGATWDVAGVCSDQHPCNGPVPPLCSASRTGNGMTVLGRDKLKYGSCTLTRNGAGTCEGTGTTCAFPPPSSSDPCTTCIVASCLEEGKAALCDPEALAWDSCQTACNDTYVSCLFGCQTEECFAACDATWNACIADCDQSHPSGQAPNAAYATCIGQSCPMCISLGEEP